MARCPAHDDRTPSLSIGERDGKVLFHCFAGCSQSKVRRALIDRGLRPSGKILDDREEQKGKLSFSENKNDRRTAAALRVWNDTLAASGTLVAVYLRARGLVIELPDSIRFHPAMRHPRSIERWPAMVALVTHANHGGPMAILRTFLSRDWNGKAPIEPQKMMLGTCRGGVVRLSPIVSNSLMVGEGIETCLSAMQATGRPAWAAMSTSGLRSLEFPDDVHDVTILADGDDPGEEAARNAANRWLRQGRRVRIARPPRGLDFNNLLLGR
jgi:putative DNA primase/helicase